MDSYHSKLVETIAKLRKIDTSEAVKLLRTCVIEIAGKLNVTQSVINSVIFAEDFLHSCLKEVCEAKTLQACRDSCYCTVYNGECIPRVIKNATVINKNPDKFAKTLKTIDLENFLQKANFLHFNYGTSGLSDNTFDSLLYQLNSRLKRKNRRLDLIGAEPIEKIRAELPVPMPSLNKVYPGTKELLRFLDNAPGNILYSEKLDGVSCLVVYTGGKISGIFTRGNGLVGGDITYIKKYIKLPKKLTKHRNMMVRGELVVSKSKFHSKFESLYSNARNFVTAQVNRGNLTSYLPDLDFIAYDVVQLDGKDTTPAPLEKYSILEVAGFSVVKHGVMNNPVMFDILIEYKNWRESSVYDIDGLVLRYDVTSEVSNKLGNPYDSVAFKALLEEQIRDTYVIDVDWRISRYGRYVPVAVYEAVYVSGIRMTRASAHNAAHVRDWSMGPGTKIQVARVGDVIPQIKNVDVDRNITPIMPSYEYPWRWQRMDIVLEDIEGNREVQIARISHFFSTIESRGIGPKTIEKLWDLGYKTIKSVTQLTEAQLKKVRGFGKKKSQKILENISSALKNTPLDRYLVAFTIVNFRISRTMLKQLLRVYPSLLEEKISSAEIKKQLLIIRKAKKVKRLGPKSIDMISNEIPKMRKLLLDLNQKDVTLAIEFQKKRRLDLEKRGYNPKIINSTFVFSGWMGKVDYSLEDVIYDNMGLVSSVVTEGTSAVIVPSVANITSKMIQAHEFGVPVLTVREFNEKFDILNK